MISWYAHVRVLVLYNSGLPDRLIAERSGFTEEEIIEWRCENGYPKNRMEEKPVPSKQEAQIAKPKPATRRQKSPRKKAQTVKPSPDKRRKPITQRKAPAEEESYEADRRRSPPMSLRRGERRGRYRY